jgi:tetratricopeptide (TPR) repeat protein
MREILVLNLFLFVAIVPAKASPDSLFNKGNKLYQDGLYEEAIVSYGSVINEGFESDALYYNLANACFRSNKLGKARLYYEKSLKLNPSNEDAQENISYLEGLLADKFEEVPVIFFKKWIKSMVISRSSNQWAYASMLSFVLCILAILAYLLIRTRAIRKIGFYSSILFLFLSLSSMAASWKQHLLIRNPDAAVVTDLSVNAKSAPRETGTGLFILHEGAKVWLEDKTGGWQEIRLSDGRKGWVPAESIEAI